MREGVDVMTTDIRTAARTEAFNNHYSHKQVRDRYDADLLMAGFQEGAVWAAARVTPTRDELAQIVATFFGPSDTPEDVADAILKRLQELAEGES